MKTFFFFKRTIFYLKNLKDKYKVLYICDTPKGENHYRIHEELQTTLNSNRSKTRQQKRKRKSTQGRRKGKSDRVMVMERMVSERKRIRNFFYWCTTGL